MTLELKGTYGDLSMDFKCEKCGYDLEASVHVQNIFTGKCKIVFFSCEKCDAERQKEN